MWSVVLCCHIFFLCLYIYELLFIAWLGNLNAERTSAPWVARCPVLRQTVQYLDCMSGKNMKIISYMRVFDIDLDLHYYSRASVHKITPQYLPNRIHRILENLSVTIKSTLLISVSVFVLYVKRQMNVEIFRP